MDSQFPTPPRGTGASARGATGGAGADASDLAPGTVLGKYQIVQRLGVGGMGSVYEAIHTGINKSVALKTMSPQLAADPRAAERFMREAAAASRLDHPHVVGVTDFGTDHGLSYLIMELLRGDDLATLITNDPGRMDPVLLADIMLAVCAGVFAAHQSGVIHRDLKPQNIFLSRTSLGETVPKVLDFGISKVVNEDANASLTNTGMVMGTTHYLSPEQVQGKGVDARSDQYSLGVILYESLTGRRPHVGTSVYEIMRSISEGAFTPPRKLRPEIPAAFESVVMQAMATRPQDRFESVHGLGRALMRLASQKRRVIWADYYEGERGPAPYTGGHEARPPTARSGEQHHGTAVMNVVRPAQLSVTRTHFLPEEVRAEVLAKAAATRVAARADVSPAADEPREDRRSERRSSGGKQFAVAFALGLVGLGAFFVWRTPRLRAQLPEALRATLDRFDSDETPKVPDELPVADAPGTGAPGAGVQVGGGAPVGGGTKATRLAGQRGLATGTAQVPSVPRVSPFAPDKGSSWPFDPPATPTSAAAVAPVPDAAVAQATPAAAPADAGRTPAVAAADNGGFPADAGPMPSLLRRIVSTSPVQRPVEPVGKPSTTLRIYSEPAGATAAVTTRPKKRVKPAATPYIVPTDPAGSPPARMPPAPPPPPPEDMTPPEQVPAKRYFSPGAAPILE